MRVRAVPRATCCFRVPLRGRSFLSFFPHCSKYQICSLTRAHTYSPCCVSTALITGLPGRSPRIFFLTSVLLQCRWLIAAESACQCKR